LRRIQGGKEYKRTTLRQLDFEASRAFWRSSPLQVAKTQVVVLETNLSLSQRHLVSMGAQPSKSACAAQVLTQSLKNIRTTVCGKDNYNRRTGQILTSNKRKGGRRDSSAEKGEGNGRETHYG